MLVATQCLIRCSLSPSPLLTQQSLIHCNLILPAVVVLIRVEADYVFFVNLILADQQS